MIRELTAMLAHPLDDTVVLDPEGRRVRPGSMRAGRTTALVFVRHFGEASWAR